MLDSSMQVNVDVIVHFDIEVDRDERNWGRKSNAKTHIPGSTVALIPAPVVANLSSELIDGLGFGVPENLVN